MTQTLEAEIAVSKGEGRQGLIANLDLALTTGGASIQPGTYRVTIEMVPGTGPKRTRKREALPDPTPEQLVALRTYADAAGKRWQIALRTAWNFGGSGAVDADTYALLHQLRNTHGPAWLREYELPATTR